MPVKLNIYSGVRMTAFLLRVNLLGLESEVFFDGSGRF